MSLVVQGKVKLSRPLALSGITEKSNPILMKWIKPVRSLLGLRVGQGYKNIFEALYFSLFVRTKKDSS
jgi:hypothetical protein